jgi:hypothetical protein
MRVVRREMRYLTVEMYEAACEEILKFIVCTLNEIVM